MTHQSVAENVRNGNVKQVNKAGEACREVVGMVTKLNGVVGEDFIEKVT